VQRLELDRRDVAERLVAASSSWLRVFQVRSAISSVLKESTKLSANALS
jgi:hypothetical protein